jgi:hypothetical protein
MNRKIIIAVAIVAGSGIVQAWVKKKPITPIIIGSYVFLLVLAVLDMFGGPVSTLAGAIAMLAATYVLLTEFPWDTILTFVRGTPATVTTVKQQVPSTPSTVTL